MKNLLLLCMLALTVFSCSPDPVPCTGSTWTYTVTLQNPVPQGTFLIIYSDGYCSSIEDTTITSVWTKDVTPFSSSCASSFVVTLQATAKYVQAGVTNYATIDIYRDGDLVQTTGSALPIPFNEGLSKIDMCTD
jgi:hypothetical protein